jgi:hypothetical protein
LIIFYDILLVLIFPVYLVLISVHMFFRHLIGSTRKKILLAGKNS